MISAKIIADSISPERIRLTTLQLRYPRFIHSEFMTHRKFSRNASSSRAIPVKKLIEDLKREPAMPVFWGSNKPGMQAGDELTGVDLDMCKAHWQEGMKDAIKRAEALMANGLHKQIANRILEPWAHINVVVTATEWDNFFKLRRHPDAQPEMKALADAIWEAMEASTPAELRPGEWHLPYILPEESEAAYAAPGDNTPTLIHASVARCARVSYLTFEGKPPEMAKDLELYDKLVGSEPLHASPAEHQGTPDEWVETTVDGADQGMWENWEEHGNFVGWRQFRRMLPGGIC